MIRTPRAALRAALAASLLSLPVVAQNRLWKVDWQLGPGADFSTIQAAIDAAADGDLIYVVSGDYDRFVLQGKSLTLMGAPSDIVVIREGGSQVRDLAPGQAVVLRDLDLVLPGYDPNAPDALEVANCLGTVWIENCLLEGGMCPPAVCSGGAGAGLYLHDSTAVTLVRAVLRCRDNLLPPHRAGTGLVLRSASAYLFDCLVSGGTTLDTAPSPSPLAGGSGGHAAELDSSFLFAEDSSFEGGRGGWGAPLQPPGSVCSDAGDGGDGVRLSGSSSLLLTRGGFQSAGPGGLAAGTCLAGLDGQALVIGPGAQHQVLGGQVRHLQVPSPVVALQDLTFLFLGVPADQVWLAFSLSHQPGFQPLLGSPLLVPISSAYLPFGTLPPSGVGLLQVGTPPLPPGVDFANIYFQLLYIPASGPPGLGGPGFVTLLRQSP